MSGWISIDDRLPEYGKFVLCYQPPEMIVARCGPLRDLYVDDAGVYWETEDYGPSLNIEEWPVTHWMPLPKAPKVEL